MKPNSCCGISVPSGRVVSAREEGGDAANTVGGPAVVKAQIPSGKRLSSGGVRFAETPAEAALATQELLRSRVLGFEVNHVLVEERLDIRAEFFIGITYDTAARAAIILASANGGIGLEDGGAMIRREFSVQHAPSEDLGRAIGRDLGFSDNLEVSLGRVIAQLACCFLQWDALLLEVNPLALRSDQEWSVADVHLELDDEALYRQVDLKPHLILSAGVAGRRSSFEREAAEIDSADPRGVAGRLIPFEGDLGLLIGGGGASLAIMDAILDAQLKPANYCEIGGNPSVWKVKELTKLILAQPNVRRLAVIMNVVNNTRSDLVARGVIKGVVESGRKPDETIAVFRVPGSWEEEGADILRQYNVPFLGRETSLDEAVKAVTWRS